ncbi:thioesterase-like superfamily-domain-containing protein [Aspergillus pseudotamarii]|uniref:Thioesterase-like superfamily-domain-containing protein n=1 Tax=Aspergillus pseudotamarii TaxID=132259 RepID=A0A5N6S8T3_ASPPS|nr:thioesterase-like superfamily-domain-containing protein [Aspergillus pseudotamarii]KAE8131088.1 thioesterase-like superfamily-domain-containing protein [Aspergillus pseudotamarii]
MITFNQQIAVEALGPNLYGSVMPPTSMGVLASYAYGGNTLAVAVNAAYQTVQSSFHLYSICGHFVRAAKTDRRLICQIERVRETRTFQTRIIRVSQEADDGSAQLCFIASADFHIEEPRSMVIYSTLPQTKLPLSDTVISLTAAQTPTEHGLYQNIERFLDMQPVTLAASTNEEVEERKSSSSAPSKFSAERFRAQTPLRSEAEQISALAFYMDKGLAYIPANHSGYPLTEASACASLDFSLRLFTHEIDLRRWHLSEATTSVAGNARAFSEGRVWDENGRLLASMTQQTLLRPKAGFHPRI